jgi:CRP-like cAMP-binding protein
MNTSLDLDSRAASLQTMLNGFWFAGLPEALRTKLMAEANIIRLESGQRLFAQGDAEYGMYAVISGGMSISRQREDGKEALLTLIETPNWFGEITLFDRGCRTHDAHAVGKTVLVEVKGATLDRILIEQPAYWQHFGQLLTLKIRILLDQAEDLAIRTTAQRLAKRLCMLAMSNGELTGRSKRVIEVQQEQLAMMLFITRQTTNQILKNLERHGLIKLIYGAVEILDLEGLQRYSEQIF